jgi:hypothetical protein
MATQAELNEQEFSSLMRKYQHAVQLTAGCDSRGQYYIDKAYDDLQEFVNAHPEFAERTPTRREQCTDDGAGGVATGLATFPADRRRDGREECVIC